MHNQVKSTKNKKTSIFFICFSEDLKRPGINFIKILRAAFSLADLKSAKKTENLTVFFVILGSGHVKASRRTLMKLTPDGMFE